MNCQDTVVTDGREEGVTDPKAQPVGCGKNDGVTNRDRDLGKDSGLGIGMEGKAGETLSLVLAGANLKEW